MERYQAIQDKVTADDHRVFALLSHYLNHKPDLIRQEEIEEIVSCGVSAEYAFTVILAGALGLDIVENAGDKDLFNSYFNRMFHQLEAEEYYNNPYFRNIRIPAVQFGNCELKYEQYQPYEGFVCNDILTTPEGRQLPQLGFFEREFVFPAILENGRIWMTLTPNEIETMKEAVAGAFGNVLTFGLGLGYYAYMISAKQSVEQITIVENNEAVLHIFREYILPQFEHGRKIKLIRADAFEYAQEHLPGGRYDFVFTDLWHDVSDGIGMYLRMKSYEQLSPSTVFSYWIEKSMLCYL